NRAANSSARLQSSSDTSRSTAALNRSWSSSSFASRAARASPVIATTDLLPATGHQADETTRREHQVRQETQEDQADDGQAAGPPESTLKPTCRSRPNAARRTRGRPREGRGFASRRTRSFWRVS